MTERIQHVDYRKRLQGMCPIRSLQLRSASYTRDTCSSPITSGFSCTKFGHFELECDKFLRKDGKNILICVV